MVLFPYMSGLQVDKWISGFSDEIVDVAQAAEASGTDCLWVTDSD